MSAHKKNNYTLTIFIVDHLEMLAKRKHNISNKRRSIISHSMRTYGLYIKQNTI